MKCQRCEKPATYHITEITDEPKTLEEVHLCEDCVKGYLHQMDHGQSAPTSVAGALAHQLKVGQTAAELARLDQLACPVCGITFYEFRQAGRLGCPYDYVCFEEELEPLILNIHGVTHHNGKRPRRGGAQSADRQTQLIRLRRAMKDAVEKEDYERASELRDEIRLLEEED